MPRAKGGFKTRRRRNRVLKQAKGYRGGRSILIRSASEAVRRALKASTRDRKKRKRNFRQLWITRIGAAAKEHGISYSRLIGRLTKAGITINRKMLSELAIHNPKAFAQVIEAAK